MAIDIQSSIRYSKNHFYDFFLPLSNVNSFFLNPTDEIEAKNMLSLNPSKAIAPNNILAKILKLLINVLSKLTELFHLSFSRGAFPLIIKASKVISVHKRLKIKSVLITGQYLYYRILIKCVEDSCKIAYTIFLAMNSVIYDLQFGFRQKH